MKKSTKLLTLILSALILAPALFSCSDATSNETQAAGNTPSAEESVNESDEENSYISDDLPASADYDGYGFNILSCNFYSRDSWTLITYDELTGDPINDVLFESQANIEERFNIDIGYIDAGDTAAGQTMFTTSVNGGDHSFDIHLGHDQNTITLGKNGLCLNLMDVEQFNFDKPWWPSNTIESLRFGDKLYTASSYLSYLGLHWTRVLTVNKTFAENINMEIPYNEVREGSWTLDRLYTLTEGVSKDTNGNGKTDLKDEIAFVSGAQTWYCMQEAADIPIYRKDNEGYPYLDIDLEKIEKFVDIMDKLINGNDYAASGDFGIEPFENGRALFAYTQVGDAYDYYRISDTVYGFLPTPKLDEMQENYINACTDMPWAVPKTSYETIDIVGTIIEAMNCYNYNHVLPAYFEGALKARIADAPDDSEMLQIISDTRTLGFAYAYNLTFNNIINDCVIGNNQVASYFQRSEKAADKTLQKLIKSFEKME